jgi:UDP-glucose 4-epimerase
VDDVITAVLHANENAAGSFNAFNVATGDYITVCEIADLAVEVSGLEPGSVRFDYKGGDRGWKGDVPVVRINTDRIKALGWNCQDGSANALRRSMQALLDDVHAGKIK